MKYVALLRGINVGGKRKIEMKLKNIFGDEFPTLIKSVDQLKIVAKNIPEDWENNDKEKTDVAYLFEEIDNEKILEELPIKKEFVELRYVKGAIVWNVKRENYTKSHLNKIITHKLYKFMTIRNVNTARFFLGVNEK
jgi:uncharacterized protein (DUF1697 family)